MAGKTRQRIKQTFKKLFPDSSSDSDRSTPSTSQAGTPALPVSSSQPTTGHAYFHFPPSAIISRNDNTPHPAPTVEQSVKYDGWAELRSFSSLLIKGSAAFGPLNEAVDGILASINTFETAAQNREEYHRLRTELNMLFHDLAGLFSASTPPVMNSSIFNLAHGIERELEIIRQKHPRNKISGYMNARTDEDMILEHYRRIQWLFERLTVGVA
ncbi:hypothetical protein FRC07_013468 [Ceratobasidium sp. 392]|nr:hypothetical protein FRC07_013468 [Ceratobasidium sp. 392]